MPYDGRERYEYKAVHLLLPAHGMLIRCESNLHMPRQTPWAPGEPTQRPTSPSQYNACELMWTSSSEGTVQAETQTGVLRLVLRPSTPSRSSAEQ